MFLEILWTLEGLAAEFTLVGLEWNVDSDVGGNMVTLDSRRAATSPLTGQVEVVGGFTADVTLADVFLMMP